MAYSHIKFRLNYYPLWVPIDSLEAILPHCKSFLVELYNVDVYSIFYKDIYGIQNCLFLIYDFYIITASRHMQSMLDSYII